MENLKDTPPITDADILELIKAFDEAEVPEDRYMYYYKYTWRHPIRKTRQIWRLRMLGKL